MRESIVYGHNGTVYLEEYDDNDELLDVYPISPQHAREWEAEQAIRLSAVDTELRAYPTSDLFVMQLRETPCIIKPFLPRGGIGLIYGEDGLGKSFLATEMANAVARGEKLFDEWEAQKGVVIYLQIDMTPGVQHERVKKQKDWLDPGVWWVLGTLPGPINSVSPKADWVQEVRRINPDLLIIDTLRKTHILDENKSDTPAKVYGACRRLFGERVALLFIHHTRKDQPDQYNRGQSYRGSGAWRADVDSALLLEAHKGNLRLTHGKHRICDDPGPILLAIDPTTLRLVKAGDTPKSRAIKLVEANPGITKKDFVAALLEDGLCGKTYAYRLAGELRVYGIP